MKKIFKTKITLIFFAVLFALGCKKNEYINTPYDKNTYVLLSNSGFLNYSLFPSAAPANVELYVVLATAGNLKKGLNVRMEIDTAFLGNYNRSKALNYKLLPADNYTLETSTTMQSDLNKVRVPLSVKSLAIDYTKDYVLPLTLISAGELGVMESRKTVILYFSPVIIEGKYRATGTRKNYNADGTFTGDTPIDIDKELSNGAVPKVYETDDIANLYNYANTKVVLTVNADKTIDVSGYISSTGVVENHPTAGKSYFEPITNNIILRYKYTNANGSYRLMEETWKKK